MSELKEDSRKVVRELIYILEDFYKGYTDGSNEYEVPLEKLANWLDTHSLLGHLAILETKLSDE